MMNASAWPNILTWSRVAAAPARVAAAPALAAVFFLPEFTPLSDSPGGARDVLATAVFLTAALTDFLDGFIARHRRNRNSRFGAFLDPVADKILVTVALLLLAADERANLPQIIATAVIICREICVSALREWMADVGQRRKVNVSAIGKWKTAAQMTAIALIFYRGDLFDIPVLLVGQLLLWIAALLTVASMFFYLRAAWPSLGDDNANENQSHPSQ